MTRRVRVFALGLVTIGSAAGVWFAGAETALAPEPAKLTASLQGSTGASAAAVYKRSDIPTTVLWWGKDFVSGGANPPADGTPCSTTALNANQVTTQVIQAAGSFRRCISLALYQPTP